jgi:hypothetical protein
MSKIEGLSPEGISSAPEVLVADAVDTGRLDGASGRRVALVVLAIVVAIELVPFQIVLVSLGAQKIAAAFPAAGNQAGWVLTIWGLVGGALTPLFGKLSDIVGKKNVMTFSLLVAGAGLLIDALTTSWPLFLVGRALAAFAFPAVIISYGLICTARQAPSAPPWARPSSPPPRSPTRSGSPSRRRSGTPPSCPSPRSTLTAATRRCS